MASALPPSGPAPPADAAAATKKAAEQSSSSSAPPPAALKPLPPLLQHLDTILFAGLLDAVDVAALAGCCRALREAMAAFWAGVRAKNPTTKLSSVEVATLLALNQQTHELFVPLSQASGCASCGQATRHRSPVRDEPLCADCGTKAELAPCWSPLFRFRMVSQEEARRRLGLSGMVELGRFLPYRKLPASALQDTILYKGDGCKTVSRCKYAPSVASSVDEALSKTSSRPKVMTGPRSGETASVFLLHDVICLVVEKFGGPRLLRERLLNLSLPPLSVANPDP